MSGISSTNDIMKRYREIAAQDEALKHNTLTDEALDAIEARVNEPPDEGDDQDYYILARNWMPACVAEIRRLRAENKELRASYERVEKYGQDLLQEREILAAMVPSK